MANSFFMETIYLLSTETSQIVLYLTQTDYYKDDEKAFILFNNNYFACTIRLYER